jgi:hypothetical protein
MKKRLSILVAAIILVFSVFGLTACDSILKQLTEPKGDFSVSESALSFTYAGEYKTLAAKVGDTVVYDVEWTSSDDEVVQVSNGVAIAIANGAAQIEAKRGGAVKTVDVSVEIEVVSDEPTGDFELSESALSFSKIGEAKVLTATKGGEEVSDVVWTSSNSAVAEVVNGVVIARANNDRQSQMSGGGLISVTITATRGGETASASVVVDSEFSITIGGDAVIALANLSDTANLSVESVVLPTIDDVDASYTWSSSDEEVATVDQDGKVTAIGYGVAAIKATTRLQKTVKGFSGVNWVSALLPAEASVIVEVGEKAVDFSAVTGTYTSEFDWLGFNATNQPNSALIAANRGWIIAELILVFNEDGTFTQQMFNIPRATMIVDPNLELPEGTAQEQATKWGSNPRVYHNKLTDGVAVTEAKDNGRTYIDVSNFTMGFFNPLQGTYAIYGGIIFVTYNGVTQKLGSVNNDAWLESAYTPYPGMVAHNSILVFDGLTKVVEEIVG